jgi:oxygen-independent coproporphyrinogen III oxidase
MVDAIVTEITANEAEKKTHINTIYFGGGTPSILATDDLVKIFDALRLRFVIATDAEITLEANPDDINDTALVTWRQLGINRLSVGMQSFIDEELKWMNRAHNAAASFECINRIQTAGFTNFSVDLIYGSPLLTDAMWEQNVATVIEKKIPHISCYALTVEPKTALQKMIALKKKQDVDAEKQASQFLLLMQWMEAAGYEHYEISNFALPGMRSCHNSSYWNGDIYFGFGPSAHAFDGKQRKWNVANNTAYISAIMQNKPAFETETLTSTQRLNEYIMTSLRTMEGLYLTHVEQHFGKAKAAAVLQQSEKWQTGNKLFVKDKKIVLTREGRLFADGIAADLFFAKE